MVPGTFWLPGLLTWPAYALLLCAATLVLKALPKPSVNLSKLTALRVMVWHWFGFNWLDTPAFKPCWTKPTIGVGWVIGSGVAPLVRMFAMICAGPEVVPPPAVVAFVRMFVMRNTRAEPVVTGARIGIPKNVT